MQSQEPIDKVNDLIQAILQYNKDIESMSELNFKDVARMFGAVQNNFHLLLPQHFKKEADYQFYKEFAKRTHKDFKDLYEPIYNGEEKFIKDNYFLVRIALSTMLIALES